MLGLAQREREKVGLLLRPCRGTNKQKELGFKKNWKEMFWSKWFYEKLPLKAKLRNFWKKETMWTFFLYIFEKDEVLYFKIEWWKNCDDSVKTTICKLDVCL